MASIQKITPNLWFDKNAEEAVNFYTSVFPNSGIGAISHYGKEGFDVHGMPAGTVLTVEFYLEGHRFIALNGGPHFSFNEAVSFIVNCDTQDEIDVFAGFHVWGYSGCVYCVKVAHISERNPI